MNIFHAVVLTLALVAVADAVRVGGMDRYDGKNPEAAGPNPAGVMGKLKNKVMGNPLVQGVTNLGQDPALQDSLKLQVLFKKLVPAMAASPVAAGKDFSLIKQHACFQPEGASPQGQAPAQGQAPPQAPAQGQPPVPPPQQGVPGALLETEGIFDKAKKGLQGLAATAQNGLQGLAATAQNTAVNIKNKGMALVGQTTEAICPGNPEFDTCRKSVMAAQAPTKQLVDQCLAAIDKHIKGEPVPGQAAPQAQSQAVPGQAVPQGQSQAVPGQAVPQGQSQAVPGQAN